MTELEKAADNYTEKAENILKYSDGWEEYSDWEYVKKAYINGANWAINKACECHGVLVGNLQLIVKEDAGGYPYIPVIELYDYEKDISLAKVGDKVKVLIFKEE